MSAATFRRRLCTTAVAAVALAGGISGCGGPRATQDGRTLFDAGCRSCHSLIGNESLRRVGGDLLAYRFSRSDMIQLVGEMPVRRSLDSRQIAVVSDYVLALEHAASRNCRGGGC